MILETVRQMLYRELAGDCILAVEFQLLVQEASWCYRCIVTLAAGTNIGLEVKGEDDAGVLLISEFSKDLKALGFIEIHKRENSYLLKRSTL